MARVASLLRARTRRGVLALAGRRGGEVAASDRVPARLTWPLRRDGLDPGDRLSRLSEDEPVHLLTSFLGLKVWLVTAPDQARSVLANEVDFSNDIRPHIGSRGPVTGGDIGGLGFTDPPEHTRLRHLLTPQFTVRRLERLRPLVTGIVERQLDALESRGPVVDLVPEFAFPVPFSVICELLGLPDRDRETFRQLGSQRFDVRHGGHGTFGAASRSRDFLLEATRRQRARPGDGLIGDIIRNHGDEVSDLELAGLADGVFTGGLETSASMLALGTAVLLEHPDDYRALVDRPESVEPTVEELLRYLSVVQVAFPRFARHDLVLAGRHVAEGDVVVCHLAAANRAGDGRHGYDAARGHGSHLAFGHGFHRCVGAELARMELRTAFPALARRFPDLALAVPPDRFDLRQLSIVFGIGSLPVRLVTDRTGPSPAG
ncbi:cytochrome P450 [Nocardioides sp. MAHUQ-72]|uniref:cytochrome P450 n=1 Tax=unclassified Nocardioides TaxID=2615069 RepID=UPI00361E9D43